MVRGRRFWAELADVFGSRLIGSRKNTPPQGGRGGLAIQDDPRGRPRGRGALGRSGFTHHAGRAAAVAEARAGRVYRVRVHGGAGEISQPFRASWRIFKGARYRLDLSSRQSFLPAAGGRTRPWLRPVQPLPAPRGLPDR